MTIDFPPFASPAAVGRKVVERFLATEPESYSPDGSFVMYAASSLWLNALKFSRKYGCKDLEDALVQKFLPYMDVKRDKCLRDNHVDFSVFGTVPLEVYILTGNERALEMGLHYADHQWEAPDPGNLGDTGNADYDTQMGYLAEGLSPQSRLWIEDMYMITVLQTQAYLATGDMKYLERTAKEMAFYLDRMQLENGLFHHCALAPFFWGRGNGWVAGGMPLLLKYLPTDNPNRARIVKAYRLMMSTLLSFQHKSGLWGQLVDAPEAWDESSCSGMFISAFISGVTQGILPERTYGPAAAAAWTALCAKIDAEGNVADVGAGTNATPDRRFYLDRPRITGAPHGQAALLWAVNEMTAGTSI